MRTGLKLDFVLPVLVLLFANASWGIGTELVDPESVRNTSGLVEIEYPPDPRLSYTERRTDGGWVFGVRYENFSPTGYSSSLDAFNYGDIFGSNAAALIGAEFGYKRNFSGGAIVGKMSYGAGDVSKKLDTRTSTLSVTRMGAHLAYWMDNIWSEPYVVPYVQMDMTQFGYTESFGSTSASGSSDLCFGYQAGLMFQLNWLDKSQAQLSLVETGLNNAYVDIFITQTSTGPLSTGSVDYGAGLVVEY